MWSGFVAKAPRLFRQPACEGEDVCMSDRDLEIHFGKVMVTLMNLLDLGPRP